MRTMHGLAASIAAAALAMAVVMSSSSSSASSSASAFVLPGGASSYSSKKPQPPSSHLQQQGQRPRATAALWGVANQLEEEGLTVAGVLEAYEAEKAAKRAKEDAEYARLQANGGVDDGENAGVVEVLRGATESKAFQALEVGMGLLLFALLDGAFSGDWTEYGLISDATEGYLKAAAGTVLFAHVCLAGLTSVVAEAKGRNDDAIVHILRTLAVGGLDFVRVAVMPDKDQLDARELAQAPPLSMEVSTFQMAATKATDGLLLSTTIKTLPGKDGAMRKLLVQLVEASKDDKEGMKGLLSTMAVNQDPEDRRNFLMLQRFPSLEKMKQYQNAPPFKDFTKQALALLSEPLGLYIANERRGRLSEPNYPFGPGGEGGRDDAIYSSPTNLDGSQSGAGQLSLQKEEARRG